MIDGPNIVLHRLDYAIDRLTCCYNGFDRKLTDVHGRVSGDVLA